MPAEVRHGVSAVQLRSELYEGATVWYWSVVQVVSVAHARSGHAAGDSRSEPTLGSESAAHRSTLVRGDGIAR